MKESIINESSELKGMPEAEGIRAISEQVNASERVDIPINDFLDMITGNKGGTRVVFGYVSVPKLDIPVVKRKNPDTGRMKGYPDWERFSSEVGEKDVAGVLKFTHYHLNWRSMESYNRHYVSVYKYPVNALRDKYGVEGIADKGPDYATTTVDYERGLKVYSGSNEELRGHSYSDQDLGGKDTKISSHYYLIGKDGHLIREIGVDGLKGYMKVSTGRLDFTVFKKLLDKGYTEEQVEGLYKQYMDERKDISFRYCRFEHTAIVYMIASISGKRKHFLNDNLREKVGDVVIDPLDFLQLTKSFYQADDRETQNSDLGDIEE